MLLHGTGGHAEAYLRNIRALSASFRVIAYDMVGHGFTDTPRHAVHARRLRRAPASALLDALGIERAHLSGESLGGWVAAWAARRIPSASTG